jgi:hypothetical protein
LEFEEAGEGRDAVVQLGDLSLSTLIALIGRLRLTETPNQFLCRELELDEAYVQADSDLRVAQEQSSGQDSVEQARVIRSHVLKAHDLLGESDIPAAVQELNKVVELKLGL